MKEEPTSPPTFSTWTVQVNGDGCASEMVIPFPGTGYRSNEILFAVVGNVVCKRRGRGKA
jgi:hypothetical protein